MDVDRPRVDGATGIPREVEQLTAGERPTGVRREGRQELVLLGPERDDPPGTSQLVSPEVQDGRLGDEQTGVASRLGDVVGRVRLEVERAGRRRSGRGACRSGGPLFESEDNRLFGRRLTGR